MQMLAPATRLQTQPPLTQLLTQPPLTHLDTQPPPSGTLPTLLPPGSGMPIAPAPAEKRIEVTHLTTWSRITRGPALLRQRCAAGCPPGVVRYQLDSDQP